MEAKNVSKERDLSIRGSCEALSKVYELNISPPDFSEVCRV